MCDCGNGISIDGAISVGSVQEQRETILVVQTAFEAPDSGEFVFVTGGTGAGTGGVAGDGTGSAATLFINEILSPVDGLKYYVHLYRDGKYEQLDQEFTLEVHNTFAERIFELKDLTDEDTYQTLRLFVQAVLGGLLQAKYEYVRCKNAELVALDDRELLNDAQRLQEYFQQTFSQARSLLPDMTMTLNLPFQLKPEYQAYVDAILNDPTNTRNPFEGGVMDAEVLASVLAKFQN